MFLKINIYNAVIDILISSVKRSYSGLELLSLLYASWLDKI